MSDSKTMMVCRLCKGIKQLCDVFKIKIASEKHLHKKIKSCVGVKINHEDNLPTLICRKCKMMIIKFYDFRQNCLKTAHDLIKEYKEFPLDTKELNIKTMSKTDIFLEETSDGTNYAINCNSLVLNTNLAVKTETTLWETTDSHDDLNKIGFIEYKPTDVVYMPNNQNINYIVRDQNTNAQGLDIDKSLSTQCDLCGSLFDSKKEFKRHLETHKTKKLFQCKFCPKHFTRADTKNIHMRSHLGIRLFICDICGQSASKRQDLIRHMKIHTDEKNHACQKCGRRFKRSSDLCSHVRTHTGARPFKCRLCEKDYTSHSGLRKHVSQHKNIGI